MSRFTLPVPEDQNALRELMAAGWQMEARFDEEARMVPPPELEKLMGFRDFVCDTERRAVEVAMRDSLDAAWAEVMAALPDHHGGLHLDSTGDWGRIDGWTAYTYAAQGPTIAATGPTPAVALRTLASRLTALGAPERMDEVGG